MNNILEIKKEMSKVLGIIKLPESIHRIVKELYVDYENSYRKLIKALKDKYPDKEDQINKLQIDILEDYNEDIKITQLVEFEEYEQRRAIILEDINLILNDINKEINIPENRFSENMLKVMNGNQNKQFAIIIMNNTISEIESSGKYVLNRTNSIDLLKDEELAQLERQFKEEILEIRSKGIERIPEISENLKQHYEVIYNQLNGIIENYKSNLHINNKNGKPEEDNER